ncbi:DUF4398 domain-containing protein [Curvibacter sp. HBC28]|uniref:DUF4398 domain-containing protein n=1 Tax=Curvibacter microcysteis TaxID=3026419 RepID=A0ABT5MGX1_9BURK|nr:DUF4398 domain-containing protein [Curvibacter sp. HBC28]MDD0814425.1 DUF4398 domain-containing protein [Curvibacter sp. HBC28]
MFQRPRSFTFWARDPRMGDQPALAWQAGLVLTALCLTACAGVPVPEAQMAAAEAAVRSASASPTPEFAPAELQLARDKLVSARQALAARDNALARRLAEQAVLDSQVAELHAESVRSRQAAQEARAAARALQEEINRKPLF